MARGREPSEARCWAGMGRETPGAGEGCAASSSAAGGRSWGARGRPGSVGSAGAPGPGLGGLWRPEAGLQRAGERLGGAAASILCSRCGVQRQRQVPRSLVRVPWSPEPPSVVLPRLGVGWGARSIFKVLPFSYPRLEDGFCHVFPFEKSAVIRAPPPFWLFRMRSVVSTPRLDQSPEARGARGFVKLSGESSLVLEF